jgi:hypothetical protein
MSSAQQPGRSCPLHYRYTPESLNRAADFVADTLYVIGGLYGNAAALRAIKELAAAEAVAPTLAFNGDFNWFNIDASGYRAINEIVLRHHALRGNVETELANDDDAAGCGCGYPDSVSDAEVERSNTILARLRETAKTLPELRAQLAALPMSRVAQVGKLRVAIVHGDCESLAGWSYDDTTETNAGIMKLDMTVAGGSSGSGLLDSEGRLIGLIVMGGVTRFPAGDERNDIDWVDCRHAADTNGDELIDDEDTCLPTGGFINGAVSLFPLRQFLIGTGVTW